MLSFCFSQILQVLHKLWKQIGQANFFLVAFICSSLTPTQKNSTCIKSLRKIMLPAFTKLASRSAARLWFIFISYSTLLFKSMASFNTHGIRIFTSCTSLFFLRQQHTSQGRSKREANLHSVNPAVEETRGFK